MLQSALPATMTRTSRLLMLAALQALTFSAGAANASRNLGHPTAARMIALDVVRELQTAFERRDFNSDGLVSWEEMSAGIGEGFQPSVDLHPFGAAQCRNPTLDALSFMECNVFRAREHIKAHSEEAADPSPGFDALLSSYVMQCPDAPEAWLQGRCLGSCQDCMQPEGSGRWAVEGKSPLGGTRKKHHGMLENASVGILISSDWHVEPWYFVGNATKCPSSDGTCRFAGASISNMFECHDVAGTKSPCLLDGEKDPPIQLEESHVAAAQKMGAALHFYIGDTQAHLYTGAWDGATAVKKLMDRVLSEEVGLFGARNIAWAAGNNDGPHNAIFHEQDPLTQAWAESMLRHKIVTDELDIGWDGLATGTVASSPRVLCPLAYAPHHCSVQFQPGQPLQAHWLLRQTPSADIKRQLCRCVEHQPWDQQHTAGQGI